MKKYILWVRGETKLHERRCALTPEGAYTLIKNGVDVTIELWENRIYPIEEYIAVGCNIVESGSWKNAPLNAYILGIKNLPKDETIFTHKHIYFGHVFKNQANSKQILNAFKNGGGILFDLEFLCDKDNVRVASFSHYAGYVGAGLGLMALSDNPTKSLELYSSKPQFINQIQDSLEAFNVTPKILIIGANGKCGYGVQELLKSLNLSHVHCWGRQETNNNPSMSKDILNYDILINCIYAKENETKPLLTTADLYNNKNLKIIVDVTCELDSAHNPLPFITKATTLDNPWKYLDTQNLNVRPKIIAIDHLPSYLPKESSDNFSKQLLPYLINLFSEGENSSVWGRAKQIFNEHIKS